jgi:hypothetical protein
MGALAYPVYVPVPVVESPYYYEGGWHPEPPVYFEEERVVAPVEEIEPIQGSDYASIGTKAEREFAMISREYDLDWWQAKRVEDLVSKGVIDSVLAGGEGGEESRIVYDKTKQRLTMTGTPDDIMRVRTIIDDDRTYRLFSQEDLGELVVDAVPLVDLRFIETDSSSALRIAADNYSAADEILRSSGVAPSGREWWFNDQLGTMTVRNSVENLDSLYEFMETRPYIR